MSDPLIIRRDGDCHRFVLARPDRGNSLSAGLVEAFHDALDRSERDGVRLLVIEGEGRNLCTGFDLAGVDEATDAELLARFIRIEQLLARLWSAPFATAAVAKGRVFGAGADLFAACGKRLALPDSSFSFPGAAFGLVLGTRRLAVRIGHSEAQDLVASGAVIDTATALRFGLVSALVNAEELDQAIVREAANATRLDPVTFAGIRGAIESDPSQLDFDLAALVRSAARPGLAGRIRDYRARALEQREQIQE